MQEISNTTFSFVVESIKRKENRTTESNMRVVRYTNVRRWRELHTITWPCKPLTFQVTGKNQTERGLTCQVLNRISSQNSGVFDNWFMIIKNYCTDHSLSAVFSWIQDGNKFGRKRNEREWFIRVRMGFHHSSFVSHIMYTHFSITQRWRITHPPFCTHCDGLMSHGTSRTFLFRATDRKNCVNEWERIGFLFFHYRYYRECLCFGYRLRYSVHEDCYRPTWLPIWNSDRYE